VFSMSRRDFLFVSTGLAAALGPSNAQAGGTRRLPINPLIPPRGLFPNKSVADFNGTLPTHL